VEASVSEIHSYPLRPEGFEEPLFPGAASKRVVAEHLLQAPWLSRASEMESKGGQAVHVRRESVKIKNRCGSGCSCRMGQWWTWHAKAPGGSS
jgi:hypothetical protein